MVLKQEYVRYIIWPSRVDRILNNPGVDLGRETHVEILCIFNEDNEYNLNDRG